MKLKLPFLLTLGYLAFPSIQEKNDRIDNQRCFHKIIYFRSSPSAIFWGKRNAVCLDHTNIDSVDYICSQFLHFDIEVENRFDFRDKINLEITSYEVTFTRMETYYYFNASQDLLAMFIYDHGVIHHYFRFGSIKEILSFWIIQVDFLKSLPKSPPIPK